MVRSTCLLFLTAHWFNLLIPQFVDRCVLFAEASRIILSISCELGWLLLFSSSAASSWSAMSPCSCASAEFANSLRIALISSVISSSLPTS